MFSWLKKLSIPRPSGSTLRTIALFMGAPIFGGILVWQLMDLDPNKVCTIVRVSEESCLSLLQQIYGIKDSTIKGLLIILGMGYVMMMMRELRMQGEIKALGGMGMSIKSDDGSPMPTISTTTTVTPTPVQPGPGGVILPPSDSFPPPESHR